MYNRLVNLGYSLLERLGRYKVNSNSNRHQLRKKKIMFL